MKEIETQNISIAVQGHMAARGTSVVETEVLFISSQVSYGHVTPSGQWANRSEVPLLGAFCPFLVRCLKLLYILVPPAVWIFGCLSGSAALLMVLNINARKPLLYRNRGVLLQHPCLAWSTQHLLVCSRPPRSFLTAELHNILYSP